MDFKPGDTVRLKSGGPLMTVEQIINGLVRCSWFSEKNELKSQSFQPAALEKDDGSVRF